MKLNVNLGSLKQTIYKYVSLLIRVDLSPTLEFFHKDPEWRLQSKLIQLKLGKSYFSILMLYSAGKNGQKQMYQHCFDGQVDLYEV